MEIRYFIMIVFVSIILVGCNFKKAPIIKQQELLYNHSETDGNCKIILKTVLEINENRNKYFLVLDNNKIELTHSRKVHDGVEYMVSLKIKEAICEDSMFVHKIKNSIITDLKNEKISKSKNYKFDVRSTVWIGNDEEKPYINFK
ncbi:MULTISPECIES: hypothetical protein [Weeksellaceae]|uniref:hypothetical protein n=1 Tax=Weeksellaceae TaxID=2762318 RepID=UPI002E188EBA|nr:hypothetical protein [Bergeyella sp. RCAD1439]